MLDRLPLGLAVSFLALAAWPSALMATEWRVNPLAFVFDPSGQSVAVTGAGGTAEVLSPRHRQVRVEASFRVDATLPEWWASAGVAVMESIGDYWRLSLVQAPAASGGARCFELAECREGVWHAQNADCLPFEQEIAIRAWEPGGTYRLSLALDASGVVGEAKDAADTTLWRGRYRFPVQRPAVRTGRAALCALGGIIGRASDMAVTQADPCPEVERTRTFPAYDSDLFVKDYHARATGFFRVERDLAKRWWVVDPLGRGFLPIGIDHVTYNGFPCEKTGRRVYRENNDRRFGNKAAWEAFALDHLKEWGFNMLGAGCDPALMHRGLGHTLYLSIGNLMSLRHHPADCYIRPNLGAPCTAFPNVFHPQFAAWCDYRARLDCSPHRDDPWLFGYFIDNELAWWGSGAPATGLYDCVMSLPEGHSARQAAVSFLRARGLTPATVTDADKRDFLALAAERYFAATAAAIRRYDPNHLVLGCRFAGIDGADEVVWQAAGRHCDIVTFNCYPAADLDRNVVVLRGEPVGEVMRRRYDAIGRPMFVTEWGFSALDSGLPCTVGAGQRFFTQAERTAAARLFMRTMLAQPFLVGYDYFMWVDEPAAGISSAHPENTNYGLLNEEGEIYRQLVAMMKDIQCDVAAYRRRPVPDARPSSPPRPSPLPRELVDRSERVSFARKDAGYSLRTATGLELSGRMGKGPLFASVRLPMSEIGSFNVMLQFARIGSDANEWRDCDRVVDVDWRRRPDGARGLDFTGEWSDGEAGFQLEGTVWPLATTNGFVCEISAIRNTGRIGLDVRKVYFREYVDFAGETECPAWVHDLWKGPRYAAWISDEGDGRWFGAASKSGFADAFRFHKVGGDLHPDAPFSFGWPLVLSPGECHRPASGAFWVVALCGSGGPAEWSRFNLRIPELVR